MDEPILRSGARGEWVTYLQQLLAQAGYDPGSADGVFGGATLREVKAFQRGQGLDDDGVVGPSTWAALTGEGGGVTADQDAVPSELVAAGAPAWLSEWSDAQREAYFVGTVTEYSEAGIPEDVPLLAIVDPPADDGEVIA